MAGNGLTRKSKAITIVPLALISAAWTASLATLGTTAVAGQAHEEDLPDGTSLPAKAIEAPASVPVPGAIAPTVPNGTADQVVASASTYGIPSSALTAYQRGAQIMDAADAACHVPWELLAAIGRVESNHGSYAGSTLNADGVATPGIYGPTLNGKGGTQAIFDTDGGELDNDAVYDRAVGPMQFIPSTWSTVKVDADGDGQRNPQDIDDAALASAVYLCSGADDLGTRAGQESAVYRYNHSRAYVNLVLRIMEAYSAGDYSAIPSGTYGGNLFTPSYSTAINSQEQHNQAAHPKTTKPKATTNGGGETTSEEPTGGTSEEPTGSDGTDSGTAGGSDPVGNLVGTVTDGLGLGDVGETLTGTVTGVTKPVTDTLATLTQASAFCDGQLAAIPDPLNLLKPIATSLCAPKVQGMEKQDAAAVIPNTLTAVLGWLGLNLG